MWYSKSVNITGVRRLIRRLQLEALEDRLVPSLSDGTILVTNTPFTRGDAARGIVGVNPLTGQQTLISNNGYFSEPLDVREGADHMLYVADAFSTGIGAVIQVDPLSGAQKLIASGGFINVPQALEIDQGIVFLANGAGRSLSAVDPVTGNQLLISQGGYFSDPVGLSIAPGHFIYLADLNAFGSGAVFKVDLLTGAQTVVTSGGFLDQVTDIALDPQGNIIVSEAIGRLVRVDPSTGAQTLISSGGLLVFDNGDAVESNGAIIAASYYFGNQPSAVVGVDPIQGNQIALSTGGYLDFEGGLSIYHTHVSTPVRSQAEFADLASPVLEGNKITLGLAIQGNKFTPATTTDDGNTRRLGPVSSPPSETVSTLKLDLVPTNWRTHYQFNLPIIGARPVDALDSFFASLQPSFKA